MQIPSPGSVKALFETHRADLNLATIDALKLTPIGQGESNLNLLVTVNGLSRFNLRVGLRNLESERTLQVELDALQEALPGIGPNAYLVDFSRTHVDAPLMILDYVAGAEKVEWSVDDLCAYARTLARLHRRRYDSHGDIGKITQDKYSFLYRFDVAVDYWRDNHPALFDIPFVAMILPAVRRFLAGRNHLFTDLSHFSLVHGDAHPQNIIFTDDGIRLIDWEWASIGDPAMDITTLGWDVSTAWQIELSGERLEAYLNAYLAELDDPTLRQRRDCWMVYTMSLDQMYHRTQLDNDPEGRQAFTVERIEGYLTNRFLSL